MRILLLGNPVAHSLSPVFQNAALGFLGLDARYETWELNEFDAALVRETLEDPSVWGANVTTPYKEAVIDIVDSLTDRARRVGAVNTLTRQVNERGETTVTGDNTDVPGFLADLQDLGVRQPESAIVLGAGGAARAVLVALAQTARSVAVINRTYERAATLVKEIRPSCQDCALSALQPTSDEKELTRVFGQTDLVVDATSLGLEASSATETPASAPEFLNALPFVEMQPKAVFYDLKYGPPSAFLRLGETLGAKAHNGLGMLLRQGAIAFELWTGKPAPLDVMRAALGIC